MKKGPNRSDEQPRSEFNWPPTDEDLAPFSASTAPSVQETLREYFQASADEEEATPVTGEALPPPEALSSWDFTEEQASSSEEVAPISPAAPDEPETSVVGLEFVPAPVALACLPRAEGETSMADDGECEADATASAPANGAASEPDDVDVQAGERVSGGWEDEIAQVQKLIEELTEKLEWRAGGVVLNQP